MPQVNEIVVVSIPAVLERASYKTVTWTMAPASVAVGGTVTLAFSIDCAAQLGRFSLGFYKPSWLEVNGIALASYLAPERQLTANVTSIYVVCTISGPTRQLQQLVRSGAVFSVYCTIGGGAIAGETELVLGVPSVCGKAERAYGKQAANVLNWETENGTLTVTI